MTLNGIITLTKDRKNSLEYKLGIGIHSIHAGTITLSHKERMRLLADVVLCDEIIKLAQLSADEIGGNAFVEYPGSDWRNMVKFSPIRCICCGSVKYEYHCSNCSLIPELRRISRGLNR